MFRVSCPRCKNELKTLTPQVLTCKKCGNKFKPELKHMFFKVRCSHCGKVGDQPAKNIGHHAACPHCAEASLIPAPARYQVYLDEQKARKEAEAARREAARAERKERKKERKKSRGGGVPRRGRGRRRMAVKKAVNQKADDAVIYECGKCGAGISELNIQREEAVEHDGQWYCWDHVPEA